MTKLNGMKKTIKLLGISAFTAFLLCLSACKHQLQTTTISIVDEHRHYYSVQMGDKIWLDYEITNTGKVPLVISEIQTTCGCVSADKKRKVIPAGEKTILKFKFDSSKNLGYVQHEILLYGNFDTTSVYRLQFDINVIPHTDYTRDYEQVYETSSEKEKTDKENEYIYGNYYVEESENKSSENLPSTTLTP